MSNIHIVGFKEVTLVGGVVKDLTSLTFGERLIATRETRVDAVGYPTLTRYLQDEAASDFVLAKFNTSAIITKLAVSPLPPVVPAKATTPTFIYDATTVTAHATATGSTSMLYSYDAGVTWGVATATKAYGTTGSCLAKGHNTAGDGPVSEAGTWLQVPAKATTPTVVALLDGDKYVYTLDATSVGSTSVVYDINDSGTYTAAKKFAGGAVSDGTGLHTLYPNLEGYYTITGIYGGKKVLTGTHGVLWWNVSSWWVSDAAGSDVWAANQESDYGAAGHGRACYPASEVEGIPQGYMDVSPGGPADCITLLLNGEHTAATAFVAKARGVNAAGNGPISDPLTLSWLSDPLAPSKPSAPVIDPLTDWSSANWNGSAWTYVMMVGTIDYADSMGGESWGCPLASVGSYFIDSGSPIAPSADLSGIVCYGVSAIYGRGQPSDPSDASQIAMGSPLPNAGAPAQIPNLDSINWNQDFTCWEINISWSDYFDDTEIYRETLLDSTVFNTFNSYVSGYAPNAPYSIYITHSNAYGPTTSAGTIDGTLPDTPAGPYLWTNALADNDGLNPGNYTVGGVPASTIFGPGDTVQWDYTVAGGVATNAPVFSASAACGNAVINYTLLDDSVPSGSAASFAALSAGNCTVNAMVAGAVTAAQWFTTIPPATITGSIHVTASSTASAFGTSAIDVVGCQLASGFTVAGDAYISGGVLDTATGGLIFPVLAYGAVAGDVYVTGDVFYLYSTAVGGVFHITGNLSRVDVTNCGLSVAQVDSLLAAADAGGVYGGAIAFTGNNGYSDETSYTTLVARGWTIDVPDNAPNNLPGPATLTLVSATWNGTVWLYQLSAVADPGAGTITSYTWYEGTISGDVAALIAVGPGYAFSFTATATSEYGEGPVGEPLVGTADPAPTFRGTSYITHPALTLGYGLTVSARISSVYDGGVQMMAEADYSGTPTGQPQVFLQYDGRWHIGCIGFADLDTLASIDPGVEHCYTARFSDDGLGTVSLDFFVDGVLQSGTTASGSIAGNVLSTFAARGAGSIGLVGEANNYAIWSRALLDVEIAAVAGGGYIIPDIFLHWPDCSTAVDTSGNTNDGTPHL